MYLLIFCVYEPQTAGIFPKLGKAISPAEVDLRALHPSLPVLTGFFISMAITKAKKKEILDNLSELLKKAVSVVFLNFHGLGVTDMTAMRRALGDKGVQYLVAKKTLVRRAFRGTSVKGDIPALEGELALVYGDDATSPAREVNEFIKKHKEKLSIMGGVFEGEFILAEKMQEIASIPPLNVLYGQFVNIINSPIQGLAVALSGIAKKRDAS